jgi:hypothetical protein
MTKYRVKEIDEKFIPQIKQSWFDPWSGISCMNRGFDFWTMEEYQVLWCAVNSLAEAKEIITLHQVSSLNKIPKYHKI